MVELDLANAVMVGMAALMPDAALVVEGMDSGFGFVAGGLFFIVVLSMVTFRLESFCLF